MEKRRFADKIRALADAAWERGDKTLSTELHTQARRAEADRNKWCTCNSKTVQPMFHKIDCPHRQRYFE